MSIDQIPGASASESGSPGAAKAAMPDDALREYKLKSQVTGTALWLFMIAGFTVFNAIGWLTHQSLRMVIGLISTRLLTFAIVNTGDLGPIILMSAASAAAVVFAVLGIFALKRHRWAVLVGIVLYAIDLAVFAVALGTKDLMGLFFHVLALALLVRGYVSITNLRPAAVPAVAMPPLTMDPPPADDAFRMR